MQEQVNALTELIKKSNAEEAAAVRIQRSWRNSGKYVRWRIRSCTYVGRVIEKTVPDVPGAPKGMLGVGDVATHWQKATFTLTDEQRKMVIQRQVRLRDSVSWPCLLCPPRRHRRRTRRA